MVLRHSDLSFLNLTISAMLNDLFIFRYAAFFRLTARSHSAFHQGVGSLPEFFDNGIACREADIRIFVTVSLRLSGVRFSVRPIESKFSFTNREISAQFALPRDQARGFGCDFRIFWSILVNII